MKKFIRIQSSINIRVTGGLQSINATNFKSPNADRLNVKPAWTGLMCLIKEGVHYYPSEIKNWSTVKSLAESGKITIGKESDTIADKAEEEEMTQLKNKIQYELKKIEDRRKQAEEALKLKEEER